MSMIGNFRRTTDQQVRALLAEPESIEDFLEEGDSEAELDIDKAWHGIHYLLTRSDWGGEPPLHFIVAGGTEVGEVDVGYGPARGFTGDQVRAIWTALEPIGREQLASRFDPADMMRLQIYPTIWDRDPAEDDTLGYLLDYYDALRTFLAAAAAEQQGMLVWLN